MRLRGFTLVELLAVVGVIILLMGIGISVFKSASHGEQRGRTQAIISVVATALAAAGAEGRSVVTAEHPLASSMAKRPMYFRAVSHAIVGNGTEEAYRGVNQTDLSGAGGVALADDDWFHGGSGYGAITDNTPAPHLYGLPRRMCRVLGSAPIDITFYRTLSLRPGAIPGSTSIATPASTTYWPYSRTLTAPGYKPLDASRQPGSAIYGGTMNDVRASIQGALAPSGALEELTKLSALYEPKITDADLDDASKANQFPLGKRIVLPQPDDPMQMDAGSTWIAGRVLIGSSSPWSTWRLRNLALYDGWGRELLIWQDAGGGFNVMSAGRDGSFRWLPKTTTSSGATFSTKPWDTNASGGEKDARTDNVQVGSDTP